MYGLRILNRVSRRRSGVGRTVRSGRDFRFRERNSPPMTRMGSTYLYQTIVPLPVALDISDGGGKVSLGRRIRNEIVSFAARQFQDLLIAYNIGDAERRNT